MIVKSLMFKVRWDRQNIFGQFLKVGHFERYVYCSEEEPFASCFIIVNIIII